MKKKIYEMKIIESAEQVMGKLLKKLCIHYSIKW